MDIKDKIVLVTGASSGIGLATARLLSKNGAKLAITSRSKDKLDQLSGELPGSAVFPADMTDEYAVSEMIEKIYRKFERIDVLVNNAGRGMFCKVESIDIKEYRKLLDLNVIGPIAAMQGVIPIMRKQGCGAIVNISSGTTSRYTPGLGGYSATKHALNGISLTARNELEKDNISVSVVYPYVTKSDFYKNRITNEPKHENFDKYTAGFAQADTSGYVAELILNVIKTGEAEIFAHDWMKKTIQTGVML